MSERVVRIPNRSPWPLELGVEDKPFDALGEIAAIVRAELDRRKAERPMKAIDAPVSWPRPRD